MAYQIKYNNFFKSFTVNFSKGFSLIELIIVLGIFAVLFSISTSVYNNFKAHSNLEVATNGLVEAVRFAQSSAQSGKSDSKWGVKVLSGEIVVFSGDNYAGRNSSLDQNLSFPGGISASGLDEIIFEKLTGITTNTGTATLTNGAEIKNININEKGTVTY